MTVEEQWHLVLLLYRSVLHSCGKIWGKRFDGDLCARDLCATLHCCTINVTATVGGTRQMVQDGGPCATLHRCTLHVILKRLVERGSYK